MTAERSCNVNDEHLGGLFTFPDTTMTVHRIGYGVMQLTGPGVFGPPKDRHGAIAVLRAAVDAGINHLDTSDFYGPHVTNQLIREALHPYPEDLVITTKVGCLRGQDGSWPASYSRAELTQGIHDNLRNLNTDVLDIVNLRARSDMGPIEEPFSVLENLQKQGLIRHLGLSGVDAGDIRRAQRIAPIVCVQNEYNVANRSDDSLVEELVTSGIAYVPFFPLGGYTPIQSETVSEIAEQMGATPAQVAQAWLLDRSPNVLLITGTSSIDHLQENLDVDDLTFSPEIRARLDQIVHGF